MHKPFHDVLHPPELQGRERRRYWIAVGGWFVAVTSIVSLIGLLNVLAAYWAENRFTEEWLARYDYLMLPLLLVSMSSGILLGDYLWGKIFVKSGYLSPAAAIRIRTNRAPTARGERRHRKLSLSLSVLIPLGIAGLGVYTAQYWMIPFMLVVGLWLFFSVRAGWKQADAMMAGQEPYPEDEVKRVLHDIDPDRKQEDGRRAQ